jgi:signal transduction histidine kinase
LAAALRSQEVGALNTVKLDASSEEVFDVTKAINEMIDRVNKVDKDKAEFASMMSHELRTPLTPILGFCQALKNPSMMGGALSPTQDAAVEAIRRSAKRLQGLVSDMLDAQKLEIKKMKFKHEDILAHDLVKTSKSNFQEAMAEKNIQFVDSTKENLDITISSDRQRLEQVFNNLIVNAIDFVNANGGRIEIGCQNEVDQVLFYVKDNGIGIPSDKQKHIFAKFYQVDTSMTRKHGGTGLGLAICRGIVESLGGKIWVDSEEGKGSAFYFTIPHRNPNRNEERTAIA